MTERNTVIKLVLYKYPPGKGSHRKRVEERGGGKEGEGEGGREILYMI
jgi:hypothetical protein